MWLQRSSLGEMIAFQEEVKLNTGANAEHNGGISTFNLQLNQISLKLESARFYSAGRKPFGGRGEAFKKTNNKLSERLTASRLTAALLPRNNSRSSQNPSSPFQVKLNGPTLSPALSPQGRGEKAEGPIRKSLR